MTDNAKDSVVVAEGLRKSFKRGGEQVEVLRGIDFSIEPGDFIALMGPSGSGKTTLLNLISGLDKPSGGSIALMGQRLEKTSARQLARVRARHIGFVFQAHNLLPAMSAARNIELPLLLTKLSRKQRKQHVATALELVNLTDRAKHYPRQLSGGQEQRVSIARAIVSDPDLLLCDEPTGDLDRATGNEVLNLLRILNQEHGKTILMVTHDPHAAEYTQRTLYMEDGLLRTEHSP